MSRLLYYLILKPISFLPFWTLYWFSDLIYIFVYKIFGYRTGVVKTNLTRSFPEKSPKEIKNIQDKFYHHLCDLIVESIKFFSLSEKEALKHMKVVNPELPNAYYEQGKNIMVVGGHYCNWEYTVICQLYLNHQMASPYTVLSDPFLDKKMKQSRSKFGFMMFSAKKIKEFFKSPPQRPYFMVFGSDQSPSTSSRAYWTRFLNQDTAVLFGTEKYSIAHNLPVLFGGIRKVKRGYYEFYYEPLIEYPESTEFGEISEIFTRRIEKQILEQPEYWLWSHKRWKRKKPENVIIPQYKIKD
jgi:KDO2-lipid IV(A) lauroyltransferase